MRNWCKNIGSIILAFIITNLGTIGYSQITPKDSLVNLAQLSDDYEQKITYLKQASSYCNTVNELGDFKSKYTALIKEKDKERVYLYFDLIKSRIYRRDNEDDKAMQSYHDVIRRAEELKDSAIVSAANFSVGSYYFYKEDMGNAVKYMKICNDFFPSTGNQLNKAQNLMALGVVYQNNKNYAEAIKCQLESIEIKKSNGGEEFIPISLNNLAELYNDMGLRDSAYNVLDRSLNMTDSVSSPYSYFYAMYVKGELFFRDKKYQKAVTHFLPPIRFWEKEGSLKDLPRAYRKLSQAYITLQQPIKAMIAMDNYVMVKDSLFKLDKQAAADDIAAKYETEKKELALQKAQAAEEFAIKEKALVEESQNQRTIVFIVIAIVLLVNIVYFYLRYKGQQRDKEIISDQKEQLEVKNKEVMDSISYAKRIQNAILPTEKNWNKTVKDSFVLYLPKDVVAGDFYWLMERENDFLFAACDCTGHGVPGALVSVICNNALNRSVKEFELSKPSEILDKTREIVISEFEKSDEDIKDGMDVALCRITENTLEFSGAQNPLWVVRNNELIEIKGDKQPVGMFDSAMPFTNHSLMLEPADTIYIFTDGFVDQFGGPKGKKLKASNFKKLLLSLQNLSIPEQKEALNQAFENWKGEMEQLDDVCVIGLRV